MKESLEEIRLRDMEAVWELGETKKEVLRQLVSEAAQVCDRPMALLSLIDRNYQWVKAQVGLPKIRLARSAGFCEHAMMGAGIFEVADLSADARFSANSLVTGSAGLRAYAGVPLLSSRGLPLGALCVVGTQPGALTIEQRKALVDLSQRAMAELEMNREGPRRERLSPGRSSVSEILKMAAHKAFGKSGQRPKFFLQRVVLNEILCDEYAAGHELGKIFTRFFAEGAGSLTVDSRAGDDGLVTVLVSTEGGAERKLHLRAFPAA